MANDTTVATGDIKIRDEIREEAEKTIQALKNIGDGRSIPADDLKDRYLD